MTSQPFQSVIVGSGSYLPTQRLSNQDFAGNTFLDEDGNPFDKTGAEIAGRFGQITDIHERRYVKDSMMSSDMATLAAENALSSSGIDPETLDYLIVAQNWGDVRHDNPQADQVPNIAARIKHNLGIENPFCVAYDIAFGCPGWVQAVIQANYYLKSGDAKRIMVIGSETLSRVIDPHDRDCMLYADGAGAVILERQDAQEEPAGIMTHVARSDTKEYAWMLWQQESFNKDYGKKDLFLKMHGRKLYKYALRHVPEALKACIEKSGLHLKDIDKLLIHQANAKMDEAILDRLFKLYDMEGQAKPCMMPLTVKFLGNSSVATVPTVYDLMVKGKLDGQSIKPGQTLLFASVGAGMHINAFTYKVPS
ncbi:ketoacyl-ACP synthase III [Pontibacter sp. G13]|uniref:3-oxoacyl-ACP synthase III family protein n=1 Tax=Pontibacter sp. G13 TaxID=3074898 RepID=UPI00288B00EB|nr:ketoacyl-ACP synthase III [Pontibacter sp. G13]WNJ16418.1 ketoacyl-ACP synthase III [Pontibacter sp. G13]